MAGRDAFLAEFDQQFREGVLSFAERLNNTDADVVMSMARKATCFVDALSTVSLVRPQQPTLSDRVLDMNLASLAGRKVLLVDDVVISGTTLHEAKARLVAAGAKVSCEVVGVDRESWSPDLVQPRQPYLSLTNQASVALCGDIVSAISLIPRPYNVDWPMSTLRLPKALRQRLHNASGFASADVTTSTQHKHGITSFTCAPEPWLQKHIDGSFGWPTGRFAQLAKVRLYVAPLPAGRDLTVRVVPLFSFQSLRTHELDQLWASAVEQLPDMTTPLNEAFITRTSKLRLLQFLISARYGAVWVDRLQRGIDVPVRWAPEKAQADFIFTQQVSGLACRAADMRAPLFQDVPVFNANPPNPPLSHKARLRVTPTASLQQQLTRPFTDLYETKEQEARRLAKTHGQAALTRPEYRQLMARLKVGYSMKQLIDLFRRSGKRGIDEFDATRFASLWLDLALDAGIAVPVTAEQGDTLVRAFRHGEDVHFGEAEEHLCWVVLNAAAAAWSRENGDLPQVATEKILVLFLRWGVITNTLRRWEDGRLGDPNTVGIRFALHGAVVRAEAREMFGDALGLKLTDRLSSAGRLTRTSGRGGKPAWKPGAPRPSEHLPLTAKQISDANLLGVMLGRRLKMPGTAEFSSTQLLTLLATCGPEADLPAALAAEVSIVLPRLTGLISLYRNNPKPGQIVNPADHKASEAAHSGHWKFTSSYSTTARKQWLDLLARPSGETVDDLLWAQVVDAITLSHAELRDADVNRLIKTLGLWLNLTLLALRVIRLAAIGQLDATQRTRLRDNPDDVLLRCLELATDARSAHDNLDRNNLLRTVEERLRPAAHSIALRLPGTRRRPGPPPSGWAVDALPPTSLTQLHQSAVEQLVALQAAGASLVDETHARSSRHGGLRRMTAFTSMLRIEVADHDDADKYASTVHDVIESHRKRTSRGAVQVLPAAQTSNGWTVVSAHREGSRHLARIAAALVTDHAPIHGLRMAIAGHLPREDQLYCGDDSTEWYGDGFFKRVGVLSKALARAGNHPLHIVAVDPVDEKRATEVLDVFFEAAGATVEPLLREVDPPKSPFSILPTQGWAAAHARGAPRVTPQPEPAETVALGIVTVIAEELQAVIGLLRRHGAYEELTDRERTFHTGTIQADPVGPVKVVATRCLDRQATSAMGAYNDLVRGFHPKVVVLLGIAGSIHDDLKLGDVVLASQVVQYENRKETKDGTMRRGVDIQPPANLRRRVNDFFDRHGTAARLTGSNGPFVVRSAPIGTGSAVVGVSLSEIKTWLHRYNDKTAAVETEAAGITTAFYESAASDDVIAWIVIRGISDRADEDKDDDWHVKASENAARTLELLTPYLARLTNA